MIVQRIDFKDGAPDKITVEMTVDELALIAKLTGRESGVTLMDAGLEHLQLQNSSVYDGASIVFNSYYENGVEGYLRGDTE